MGWKGIGLREEQGWEDSEVSRGAGGLLSRHRLALLDVFVVSVYMIIDFVCCPASRLCSEPRLGPVHGDVGPSTS